MLITQMQKTLKTFEFLSTKNEKNLFFFKLFELFMEIQRAKTSSALECLQKEAIKQKSSMKLSSI